MWTKLSGGVLTVALDRPDRRNAVDADEMNALVDAVGGAAISDGALELAFVRERAGQVSLLLGADFAEGVAAFWPGPEQFAYVGCIRNGLRFGWQQ